MHKLFQFIAIVLLSTGIWLACNSSKAEYTGSEDNYYLIPQPAQLVPQKGIFIINADTKIALDSNSSNILNVAQLLKEAIFKNSGHELQIENSEYSKNTIAFQLNEELPFESYDLEVSSDFILIKSGSVSGAFYAIQTLRQLMPPVIESGIIKNAEAIQVPAVKILDSPRFKYRGFHLDVGRHFFPIDAIKNIIDQIAYYKINRFHWHLTEDQGWRIEIKKYPKLTEVGAFRQETLVGHYNDQPHQFDGEPYGGYYTQDEIREIVKYAEDRSITVIPEIELPGHSLAALAAYPELACSKGPFEVGTKWGVYSEVYCPTEQTFSFLEDVLTEVMDLFPSKYIHIGGDECPKTRWKESDFCQNLMAEKGLKNEYELQSYFIQRIEQFLNANGRNIIGWDEILEGGLAPNATVMSWRGIEGGIEAAKSGHDVIMTPTSHCYFDYYQSDHPDEPLAIGGFLPLEKVYHYEPIPSELIDEQAKHVIGAQANLWTEYIKTVDKLEYMMFPRLCALSEIVWSTKESRNFEKFVNRLTKHIERMKIMGVNTANHLYDPITHIQPVNGRVELTLHTLAKNAELRYSLDGDEPVYNSKSYDAPLGIESSMEVKAQSFLKGKKTGRPWSQKFNIHKAAGKKISLVSPPHPKYRGGGDGSVINGVLGSNERYGDSEWLGFEGKDFVAVIDLASVDTLNELVLRFFNGEGQWIYLPESIDISISSNGIDFEKIASVETATATDKVYEMKIPLQQVKSQFVKIFVKNYGIIPEGRQGGGNQAWLFIDEIQIF